MSCNNPIYVDDVGTTFRVTVEECLAGVDTAVDVSGQSAMSFFFKLPDKTLIEKTPVFTDDGIDGQIEYVILSGELNLAGKWALQAEVTLASGTFRSSIIAFTVHPKLESG